MAYQPPYTTRALATNQDNRRLLAEDTQPNTAAWCTTCFARKTGSTRLKMAGDWLARFCTFVRHPPTLAE
eukprot:11213295-Lingulodinium_polyedra.AAC.1